MAAADSSKYLRLAWVWITLFALFRYWYSGLFLLSPDETNYWQWGRHLDWGYHDQAPLIGWAIRFCTELFGDTERAVRLPSVLALTAASAYLVVMANHWFDGRVAWRVALLSQGVLLFNVGGLLATADGLQAVAWAGAAYHTARAYEKPTWSQWLLAGFWFGFGLLSKYTMVVFAPCALAYGLLSPLHRGRLATLKPYAGALFGSLMFMPVIYWNWQHDWNSVRHVAYLGGANESFAIHGKYLADFLGSQAGLLTPLVFILMLVAWGRSLRKGFSAREWIYPYLFLTSFPVVAGFALLSLHTRVYGNWPGAGYLTAAVLAAAFFMSGAIGQGRGGRLWSWAVTTAYLLTGLVLLQTAWPVLPLPADLDRTATEVTGWDAVGAKAVQARQAMPEPSRTFLFGFRYQIASELAFYTPGRPETVSINIWRRPNVYDYWWEDADLLGWDAVGVSRSPDMADPLGRIFERVEGPEEIPIYRTPVWPGQQAYDEPVRVLYLYRGFGFKGGLRWQPPDAGDIRAG